MSSCVTVRQDVGPRWTPIASRSRAIVSVVVAMTERYPLAARSASRRAAAAQLSPLAKLAEELFEV